MATDGGYTSHMFGCDEGAWLEWNHHCFHISGCTRTVFQGCTELGRAFPAPAGSTGYCRRKLYPATSHSPSFGSSTANDT